MRLLFTIDRKNYFNQDAVYSRPSARGIIIKNQQLAMVHSLKRNYYKFPGGGIRKGEQKTKALIREVLEETGLIVIPTSIKEYGYVHRIEKGSTEDVFIQDNYYYFCECEENMLSQSLDEYEKDDLFTLEFVDPDIVISTNCKNQCADVQTIIERENQIIELLKKEHKL